MKVIEDVKISLNRLAGDCTIPRYGGYIQGFLGDIAHMCGLGLEGIYRLRDKRVGDSFTGSSIRMAASKAKLDESAVVVRKP